MAVSDASNRLDQSRALELRPQRRDVHLERAFHPEPVGAPHLDEQPLAVDDDAAGTDEHRQDVELLARQRDGPRRL